MKKVTASAEGGAMPSDGSAHAPSCTASNVIAFPRSKRPSASSGFKRTAPRQESQHERHPLPFFDAKSRSSWTIRATGNYSADYAMGQEYALAFLESNDGTVGWRTLLAQIVKDMIGAGPCGRYPSGAPKVDCVVIGFMNTLGSALIAGAPGLGVLTKQ